MPSREMTCPGCGTRNRLGVQGIPTMVVYVDGAELTRQTGALPGEQIRRWLDSVLRSV